MELPLVEAREEIIKAMDRCPNKTAVARNDCPLCAHLVKALTWIHKEAKSHEEVH